MNLEYSSKMESKSLYPLIFLNLHYRTNGLLSITKVLVFLFTSFTSSYLMRIQNRMMNSFVNSNLQVFSDCPPSETKSQPHAAVSKPTVFEQFIFILLLAFGGFILNYFWMLTYRLPLSFHIMSTATFSSTIAFLYPFFAFLPSFTYLYQYFQLA